MSEFLENEDYNRLKQLIENLKLHAQFQVRVIGQIFKQFNLCLAGLDL